MKFSRSNHHFGTALAFSFLVLVAVNTQAKNRSYETGKLVYLSATPISVPLPDLHGGTLTLPLFKYYAFTIEGETAAHMGICFAKSTKYLPEWTTGETIEYRIEKGRIFLKRHNSKEQALMLQLQGKDQRSMTFNDAEKKQDVPECTK